MNRAARDLANCVCASSAAPRLNAVISKRPGSTCPSHPLTMAFHTECSRKCCDTMPTRIRPPPPPGRGGVCGLRLPRRHELHAQPAVAPQQVGVVLLLVGQPEGLLRADRAISGAGATRAEPLLQRGEFSVERAARVCEFRSRTSQRRNAAHRPRPARFHVLRIDGQRSVIGRQGAFGPAGHDKQVAEIGVRLRRNAGQARGHAGRKLRRLRTAGARAAGFPARGAPRQARA